MFTSREHVNRWTLDQIQDETRSEANWYHLEELEDLEDLENSKCLPDRTSTKSLVEGNLTRSDHGNVHRAQRIVYN